MHLLNIYFKKCSQEIKSIHHIQYKHHRTQKIFSLKPYITAEAKTSFAGLTKTFGTKSGPI